MNAIQRVERSSDSLTLSEMVDFDRMRADRRVFTDPHVYELELKKIWESTWLFLAHESQLPNRYDFFRTHMGARSVFLVRDADGEIRGFMNACAHRGATLCNTLSGNARAFTCQFHGWTFDTKGRLLGMPREQEARNHPSFTKEIFGLQPIPRLEMYRGFIFGSLNPAVVSLSDHLGDAKVMIDLFIDSSPEGIEVLTGTSVTRFRSNWKIQAENSLDGWHADTTHASYVMTQQHRAKLKASEFLEGALDLGAMYQDPSRKGGFYNLSNGHAVVWTDWPNFETRPTYARYLEDKERYGEEKAKWLHGRFRNLLVYPNLYLIDHLSTQIRTFRPLAVNKTECTVYCVGHRGESSQSRNWRLRQYEDCFNAGGMITADDFIEFERCQLGYESGAHQWNEFSRGYDHLGTGGDAHSEALGMEPVLHGTQFEDEGIFLGLWKEWLRLLTA